MYRISGLSEAAVFLIYGPEDVEPIFDTFLLEHMNEIKEKNQLGLSGVLLDERTAELKQMKANRPQNYYDFWNENIQKSAQPDAPFKHTDQFTYEYEAKEKDWKLLISAGCLLALVGGRPLDKIFIQWSATGHRAH